ncbi:MAG: C40 family peptidase [Spirochaetia bacterium]|nr:C40 family peptidase [Spirochaetia bacterium]
MRRFVSVLLLFAVMLFTSCESIQILDYPARKQAQDKKAAQGISEAAPKSLPKDTKGLSQKQKQLVEAAYWAKGKTSLSVNGKKYKMDCSGVVSAIYQKAGIDLTKDFKKYKGGGVQRIHETLRSKGLTYRPTVPVPGDILFWDNTYDANKNGRADDTLSHIGMVVSSDKRTGEVVYIHHHEKKGIVFEKMNLLHPNDPAYNAGMRDSKAKKLPGNKYLASQLYKDAGKGYLMK